MIARRIDRAVGSDSYRPLALYIAGAGHGEEKVLASWTAGCLEPDDYLGSIRKAEAVQAMNTRSTKEKTYHSVVSFRPEDEDKLTPDIFISIINAMNFFSSICEYLRLIAPPLRRTHWICFLFSQWP